MLLIVLIAASSGIVGASGKTHLFEASSLLGRLGFSARVNPWQLSLKSKNKR